MKISEKVEKIIKSTIVNYRKQKRQQNYKRKNNMSKRRSTLIREQNESNREIKQKERRRKRENLEEEYIDLGRFFELATTNKIYVNGLNLHEIRNQILQDYTGDFELSGLMIIGPIEHKIIIRFKKMDDFESYINAIDVDYDSKDVTFTGYIYKLNTPQFNVVKRRTYGKGTIICKKLLNIMDKIVISHLQECVLSNVIIISLKKIIQKNF